MAKRHMPDVKVVGVDRGGAGTKHTKCFFVVEIRALKRSHKFELHSSFKGQLFNRIM